MGPAESAPATPHGLRTPSPEQIQEQLERILSSSHFIRSERMSRFLRFAVEAAMNGSGPATKEYLVGVEVFDRPASYDPRVDPIVRVEARRLRAKLKAYYSGPGSHDPICIALPTGAYTAQLR